MDKRWHTLTLKETENELNTDLSEGLSIREAKIRLDKEKRRDGGERYSLFVPDRKAWYASVFSFFQTPSVIILTLISVLAAFFGETIVGFSVLAITLAGAIVGGVIRYRAQRFLDSTGDFASPMVRVIRGVNKFHTDGRNIVAGDVIMLSAGDLLPCDARLISSSALVVKELIITPDGIRNRSVLKDYSAKFSVSDNVSDPNAENMLYAGSAIVSGEAVAVVVRTGSRTYLARHAKRGELAGGDAECRGIKGMKPILHRISFISILALVVLSLVTLLTLKEASFVANFLMLLSAVAMISLEILNTGALYIFSNAAKRASEARVRRAGERIDISAQIRGVKAIDTLTDVTDLVLLGKAALYEGTCRVGETLTSAGVLEELNPDSVVGNLILTYVHTYLKALKASECENDLVLDGISDSLMEHIRACGFDISGASIVIKSLYYASKSGGDNSYACAETTMDEYRVALTFDDSILQFCSYMRAPDGVGTLPIDGAKDAVYAFALKSSQDMGRCLYVVSERDGEAVLEGVISLVDVPALEVEAVKPKLDELGIKTTLLLLDGVEDIKRTVGASALRLLFDGNIAYASDFKRDGRSITEGLGGYVAYVGFSVDDYTLLIDAMRKNGSKVASYAVDDRYHDLMIRSDIAITCDVLRYSSSKYKESIYERLAHCGRDTGVRGSQRTRLLSRVIVRRSHNGGGGLASILTALRASKTGYVSLSQSVLLFAMLMSTLLPLVATSAIVGIHLFNALQTAALAVVGAMISMLAFAYSQPKAEIINSNIRFTSMPIKVLRYKLPGIIARASLAVAFAVTVKILDACRVFGENASYSMTVFIAVLLTLFVEIFIINLDYTRRGEGRRHCLVRVLVAYTILLAISALITLSPFKEKLLPNGIGDIEFIIAPAYGILFVITVIIARIIERSKRK